MFFLLTHTGIKSAAIRKLKHELGIESPQVCIENIKYLGRIHYCAADDSTAEPAAGAGMNGSDEGAWGEHEIDYILFIKATVDLVPNPEEVRSQRYLRLWVTLEIHLIFPSFSIPLSIPHTLHLSFKSSLSVSLPLPIPPFLPSSLLPFITI